MGDLQDYFYIKKSKDNIKAEVYCKEAYENHNENWSKEEIIHYLKNNGVTNEIIHKNVQLLLEKVSKEQFPILIAQGKHPVKGKDGEIQYVAEIQPEIKEKTDWNFRDVMQIPSVVKGQKLATIRQPEKGIPGVDILGTEIPAKPGRPAKIKQGKNVIFNKDNFSFYALENGQISVTNSTIHVHTIYEVKNTLSMKEGNINFIGSVVIHGDVPSGYKINAGGDVKIYGIVEAAEIIANGSVYISEGLAGLKKGKIKAKHNVFIGYSNQGKIECGNNLYVENSILHSNCIVGKEVYCKKGSIIGGVISAGELVDVREVGNNLSTKTDILFGLNQQINQEIQNLTSKKKELQDTLSKLSIIGEKIKNTVNYESQPKLRVTLLKQKNSYQKTETKINEIDEQLKALNADLGDERKAKLVVRDTLHSNVTVGFGKYKREIKTAYKFVQVILDKNEIVIKYF